MYTVLSLTTIITFLKQLAFEVLKYCNLLLKVNGRHIQITNSHRSRKDYKTNFSKKIILHLSDKIINRVQNKVSTIMATHNTGVFSTAQGKHYNGDT